MTHLNEFISNFRINVLSSSEMMLSLKKYNIAIDQKTQIIELETATRTPSISGIRVLSLSKYNGRICQDIQPHWVTKFKQRRFNPLKTDSTLVCVDLNLLNRSLYL